MVRLGLDGTVTHLQEDTSSRCLYSPDFKMDRKKKRLQNKRIWIAAKRLASSTGVPRSNTTLIREDSDSNDSDDNCTNLIETSGSGQDMFVEDLEQHNTETSVCDDDETFNMIDDNTVISSDYS